MAQNGINRFPRGVAVEDYDPLLAVHSCIDDSPSGGFRGFINTGIVCPNDIEAADVERQRVVLEFDK
jgi:hypothetical protein